MEAAEEQKSIVLLEDDYWQADSIREELERRLNVRVERIATEQIFESSMHRFREALPALFILDVLVRYTDPSPDPPPVPAWYTEWSYFYAGIRCLRLLRADEMTQNVPVLIYTVLDPLDIQAGLEPSDGQPWILTKTEDLEPLVREVRSLISQAPRQGAGRPVNR